MRRRLLAVLMLGLVGSTGAESGDGEGPAPDGSRALYARPADIPYPDADPPSPAKVRLGRDLFFDPILSGRPPTT